MSSERRGARLLAALLAVVLTGCYEGDSTGFHDAVVIGSKNVTGLAISGDGLIIEIGEARALVATGTTPTGTVDLTGDVTWRSDAPAAVNVSDHGVVTGLGNGSAVISATLGAFVASATVTASDALLTSITVSGAATVDECGTGTYTASGQYDDSSVRDITTLVGWSVSDSAIARMSGNLLVSTLAGSVNVTASRSGINSTPFAVTVSDNLVAIDVTPDAPAQIHEGDTLNFTATGNRGGAGVDISRATQWTVVNDGTTQGDIASIGNGDSSPGHLTAENGGTGTVTGSCGGLSDSVDITVVYLDTLTITNDQPVLMAVNGTRLLVLQGTYSDGSTRALNESASWTVQSVSGTPVTVSNVAGSRGLVTAGVGIGISTVTATVGDKSYPTTVTVQ